MRVLVVSPERGTSLPPASLEAEAIETAYAASPAEAIEALGHARFEAVVVDARFLTPANGAATSHADLAAELRRHARGATLLALGAASDRTGPHDWAHLDGLLPRTVPAHVQAQILLWAAERARLGATLSGAPHARTRELEQSRARFRDVIERNADAIVVVDRHGTIRFANSVAAALFRRKREELIGSSFGYPVVAGETTELDLWRNGSPCVVEMRVVESEWEGEHACIASLRDITERRLAEESARRLFREQAARAAAEVAARRFRFLAEASTLLASSLDHRETFAALARMCVDTIADWVVIYTLDEDGHPQRAEATHRDPDRHNTLRQLCDQPIDPHGSHPVLRVIESLTPMLFEEVDDAELHRIAQDGEHLRLLRALGVRSFMIAPLIARGRCLGAISFVAGETAGRFDRYDLEVVQDLALRAALAVDNSRLYREAQDADRAKSDLLAVISHDLNTPLNAIMGHAELLEMGIPEPLGDAALERVARIRESARHLLYLISELLSFARLDAGRERVEPEEIDARTLVQEIGGVLEPLASRRGLHFRVECDDSPLTLRTDPNKLRQILLNLGSNAVRYTEQGEVGIEVRSGEDGTVQIRVCDTGVGIDDGDLPHIFEPFWQVEAHRGSSDAGTGLGLSVVHRLVELLGGSVDVESSPGSGSTFTVSLPCDFFTAESAEDAEVASQRN